MDDTTDYGGDRIFTLALEALGAVIDSEMGGWYLRCPKEKEPWFAVVLCPGNAFHCYSVGQPRGLPAGDAETRTMRFVEREHARTKRPPMVQAVCFLVTAAMLRGRGIEVEEK
jgi:hypothetical protein